MNSSKITTWLCSTPQLYILQACVCFKYQQLHFQCNSQLTFPDNCFLRNSVCPYGVYGYKDGESLQGPLKVTGKKTYIISPNSCLWKRDMSLLVSHISAVN